MLTLESVQTSSRIQILIPRIHWSWDFWVMKAVVSNLVLNN